MESTKQKRFNKHTIRVVLIMTGCLIGIYLSIMSYLYFYPALDFTVQLPVNPPSILEPKLKTIQTHVDIIPGNGLGQFEFFIIPSSRTNFYANVDGGSLMERKMTNPSLTCQSYPSTRCEQITTNKGQRYLLVTVKDTIGKISSMSIYFNRGDTAISIQLTERPQQLDRAIINEYIDSFQAVHESFPVDHLTPGV